MEKLLTEQSSRESLLLPERSRLFYIGLPKTGTTAMQTTASSKREELLAAGVRYPGLGMNHRLAVAALMGKRIGWDGAVPPQKHWNSMMSEVEADQSNRIWISHEFACEADDASAERFASNLGEPIHVVITLRNYASTLASVWQQSKKIGNAQPFEAWLQRVLVESSGKKSSNVPDSIGNQGGIVERWASIVGKQNVTVILVDKSRPKLLGHSFEDLLGLPRDFLSAQSGGFTSNRSMSLPEAELLQRLNTQIKGKNVSWTDHLNLIQRGAVKSLLTNRVPGEDEDRILVPDWAAEVASARGHEVADRIQASGVRVVGNLETLHESSRSIRGSQPAVDSVPMDAAVEAMMGLFTAALKRDVSTSKSDAKVPERSVPAVRAAANFTTHDLIKALKIRLTHKVRTGRSKPTS